MFLFKWNANIEMQPDLDDIREYCKENKAESFLLRPYSEIMQHLFESDIKETTTTTTGQLTAEEQAKVSKKVVQKGSKEELISYLVAEVGSEIEFAWRTEFFYLKGQIKTEDLGSVIALLVKSGAI